MKIGFSTFPSSLETQNVPSYSEWKGNVKVFTARDDAQNEPSQIKFFIRDGFYGATFLPREKFGALATLRKSFGFVIHFQLLNTLLSWTCISKPLKVFVILISPEWK